LLSDLLIPFIMLLSKSWRLEVLGNSGNHSQNLGD